MSPRDETAASGAIEQTHEESSEPSIPTVVWVGNNLKVLFWCWLLPITNSPIGRFPPHQRSGARAFAIVGIILLTFLIRSVLREGAQSKYSYAAISTIVAGLAVAAAIAIDLGALLIAERLRERVILSGLTSTFLTMLFYVLIYAGPGAAGWTWYENIARDLGEYGFQIWPAVLAVACTFIVWFGISVFVHRRGPRIALREFGLALLVGLSSGVLVVLMAIIPEQLFSIVTAIGGSSGADAGT